MKELVEKLREWKKAKVAITSIGFNNLEEEWAFIAQESDGTWYAYKAAPKTFHAAAIVGTIIYRHAPCSTIGC